MDQEWIRNWLEQCSQIFFFLIFVVPFHIFFINLKKCWSASWYFIIGDTKTKCFFFLFFLQIHHGLQELLIGLGHQLQHDVEVSQPGQQLKHRHFTRCHVPPHYVDLLVPLSLCQTSLTAWSWGPPWQSLHYYVFQFIGICFCQTGS